MVSCYLEKLHRLFFSSLFSCCEVALGTGVVTAVGEREREDDCEYSGPCLVSDLEKAFGGLGASVHPETSCGGVEDSAAPWYCCCQALCPGGWMSQMFFKGSRPS